MIDFTVDEPTQWVTCTVATIQSQVLDLPCGFSADFREPSAESSQIICRNCSVSVETLLGIPETLLGICGNIAGYPRKHCWVSAETLLGIRGISIHTCGMFEGDCTTIYLRVTQSPVDCGWPLPMIRVRIRIVAVSVMFVNGVGYERN